MARVAFYGAEGEFTPLEDMLDWIRDHPMENGRCIVLCMWGSRGIGKSALVEAYCKKRNIAMKLYHPAHDVDGSGIVGLPMIDEKTGETTYALPEHLPTANDGDAGIWFIDEINRANEEVLAGLMEPLGSGTISQSGWSLPQGWNIVVVANPKEAGYQVHELDEAMIDRMLHYAPGWDQAQWANWAERAGLSNRIIDFMLSDKENVQSGEPQPPQEIISKMSPTPRSYTYLAALYEPDMPDGLLRTIASGLLPRDTAEKFIEAHNENLAALTFRHAQDQGNGKGVFEAMRIWREQNNTAAMRASMQRIISGLVGHHFEKKHDQVELAQTLSMFFALLPEMLADEAKTALDRSALSWSDPIMTAASDWRKHWASQNSTA
jgi:MoxR-like ATPase